MRIGEVNTENYGQMLKILGVKDTTNLDKLTGGKTKEQAEAEFDHSHEARMATAAKMGLEEGMYVGDGDTSHHRIVPVSDEVKNKLIEVVRRQFLTNGNGMGDYRDGDEIGALYKEFRKNIAPSERLAFTYTLRQIMREENQRLFDYVRANVPDWRPGQAISPDVLKAAVSGKGHLDVKV